MALPFTDNFNRTSVDPIGGNWTTAFGCNGSGRIYTDTLLAPSTIGSTPHGCFVNSETFANNQYAQCTCPYASDIEGPCVRMQSDALTHYRCAIRDDTRLRLYKCVAGTDSQLGAEIAITRLSTTVFKITAEGTTTTTVKLYVDGEPVLSYDDSSSPITGGVPGVVWKGDGNWFDDFEAGDVSAAPGRNPVAMGFVVE